LSPEGGGFLFELGDTVLGGGKRRSGGSDESGAGLGRSEVSHDEWKAEDSPWKSLRRS
jgi:hypothetical protein